MNLSWILYLVGNFTNSVSWYCIFSRVLAQFPKRFYCSRDTFVSLDEVLMRIVVRFPSKSLLKYTLSRYKSPNFTESDPTFSSVRVLERDSLVTK